MQETSIRRAAMDLLARREHSRTELYRKLLRRFPYDSELIRRRLSNFDYGCC